MGNNEQAVIKLYNALGNMIDNLGVIKSIAGEAQQLNFNLEGKTPGLYYVVVTGDKGFKSTFKLLVQ
jgi:pectate lyase